LQAEICPQDKGIPQCDQEIGSLLLVSHRTTSYVKFEYIRFHAIGQMEEAERPLTPALMPQIPAFLVRILPVATGRTDGKPLGR
jgi:hypothetical protein